MVSIKSQYENAKLTQGYENLLLVAGAVFGKKDDEGQELTTFDELNAMVSEWG